MGVNKILLSSCIFSILYLLNKTPALAIEQEYYIDSQNSLVEFHASSTLHDFEGKTRNVDAHILFDPATGKVQIPEEITIPVNSLKTGIIARDKAMLKMFEADQYPNLRGKILQIQCPPIENRGSVTCEGEMNLTLRHKTKAIPIKIDLSIHKDLETKGYFDLQLSEFELKPPSVLRLIKVSNQIVIKFFIVWKVVS